MAEFKPFALDPEFRPVASFDTASKQAQYAKEQVAQLQEFMNSRRVTDQQAIEDARFSGQNFKALATLTKSGVDYYQALAKQEYNDKLIGEQWEMQMAPPPEQQQAEEEATAEGELENRVVTPIIEKLDPIAQEAFNKSSKRKGAGLYNEKGLHQKVKGLLPSHYTAFLNSSELIDTPEGKVPAFEAYKSSNPAMVQAAVNAARWNLISKYGLQYSTKTGFVKDLSESITNTEQYLLTNALTSNIKQTQTDNLNSYKGLAYARGSQGFKSVAEAEASFAELSDLAYTGNTGTSRRAANSAIVTSMAAGMAAAGNADGVKMLKRVKAIPGQEGTELGFVYGQEIDEAVAIATRQAETNRTNEGRLIERNMRNELANLPDDATPAQRTEIIQKYRKQAEAIEAYDVVDRIDGNMSTLVLSDNVAVNDQLVRSNIASGNLTDRATLESMYGAGKISKPAYDDGIKAVEQRAALSSPEIKPSYDRWRGELQSQMDIKLGVKRDPLGGFSIGEALKTLVKPEELRGYYAAYETDVVKVAQRSLAKSIGKTPAERAAMLDKDLDDWYKAQVLTSGGKYYNGGFLTNTDSSTTMKNNKDKWREYWKRWTDPSFRARPTSLPQRLSFNYGSPMPDDVRYAANLNNPDQIISDDDVMLAKANWEDGVADPDLRLASADLGVSPLTFINSQLEATDETPFKPQVSAKALARAEGKPRVGLQLFEQVGFPTKGASYLSAAVATKVGWKNPKSLDIDQWPEAMKAEYPIAFNTLMIPQATDRHLQAAVEMIFGPMPSLSIAAQSLYA